MLGEKMRRPARRSILVIGAGLAFVVALTFVLGGMSTGTPHANAAAPYGLQLVAERLSPVIVKTQRISLASPFSRSAPCAQANLEFSPGFAQESSVAVNPRNPRQILVAWIQDGRATDVVMASRDGGRTFSRILVPGLSACTGGPLAVASDPGVDFSADGRQAWFSAIVVKPPAPGAESAPTSMYAFRSFDGGFSWSTPSVIQPATHQFWDLPRLTADPRRPKRAYYVYDLREPVGKFGTKGFSLFSKTTNSGQTWSTPTKLYDPQTKSSWPGISKILVNKDNSLLDVMAIVDTDPSDAAAPNTTQQIAVRSTNRGRTWSEPIPIGRSSGRGVIDPATKNILNTFDTYPSQTVAPDGDVYVSWLQPGDTNDKSRIAVGRSTDEGRTWTTRHVKINGQAALPTIEVAGDGTVGVVYYVIAPKSNNGDWPARVAVSTSTDHGRTWSRREVAPRFNLLTTGSNARACCFLGDFEGIDRLPHGIVAAYSVGKPSAVNNVDVYFSRITTSPRRTG
jgi:hypothetical protein